ncbi:MAG: ArsC/Spx/MgsR family protein [candidate division KSB1 bacterium]|jgi:arsenate reductase|nr:ArsC/Spx/MgsR family protein [candidate division KSB1 bacterium]
MSQVKIWHNPRCRKSRERLKYLQDKNIDFEIIEYLKTGIDPDDLSQIITNSGQEIRDFIRTNEADYKALNLKNKELSAEEFAKLAAEYPKLLQRPIVISGQKSILALPADRIDDIL